MGSYNNRATNGLHNTIRNLVTRNLITGRYEVNQDNIVYSMELEMLRNLSDYFKRFMPAHGQQNATLQRWYRDLPNQLKKQVNRTGDVRTEFDGFYPDPSFED